MRTVFRGSQAEGGKRRRMVGRGRATVLRVTCPPRLASRAPRRCTSVPPGKG